YSPLSTFHFSATPPPTTQIYTLSLHDALPISERAIYHTNMTGYFTDSLDTYLTWYSNRSDGGHVYDPAKPTVAITMYQSYFPFQDRKSTRLNSSHVKISYAVFCLKKKNNTYDK